MASTIQSSSGLKQDPNVSAALVQRSGQSRFKLVYGTDEIELVDGSSLNRWAAAGIVERHNIGVTTDGVTIDGHSIHYGDQNAVQQLESFLNRHRLAPGSGATA